MVNICIENNTGIGNYQWVYCTIYSLQSRSSCHLWSSYHNRLAVPSVKLSIGFGRSPSLALLFGMLYLITLEIPPFPLMSSNVTLKLFYLLSI